MDYLQKTIAAYDNSADKYSSATSNMSNSVEIDKLLSYMPKSTNQILDVGCAFGRDCEVFQNRGFIPTGIDMSNELLKKAKKLHPEIVFKNMDVRSLDFPNESFDAVWCCAVLLHLNNDDLAVALNELHRVLVQNGVIGVSFKLGEGEKTFVEEFSANQERYYNFKDVASLHELLSNAGFTIKENYIMNERERFGPSARDLNWVWAFATKSE